VIEHDSAVPFDRLAKLDPVDTSTIDSSCARRISSGSLRQSSTSNWRRSNATKDPTAPPDDGLAIDQTAVDRQGAHRIRDRKNVSL
jgi:hypothetical protein